MARVLVVCVGLAFGLFADATGRLDGSRTGRGGGPYSLALDPAGDAVYVALVDRAQVAVLGADSLEPRRILPMPRGVQYPLRPVGLLWSRAWSGPLALCHYCRGLIGFEPGGGEGRLALLPDTGDEEDGPGRGPRHWAVGAVEDPRDATILVLIGVAAPTFTSFRVHRFALEGASFVQTAVSAPVALTGEGYHRGRWPMAVGERTGRLYAIEPGSSRIFAFDRTLARKTEGAAGRALQDLVADEATGSLYVADAYPGVVRRLDATDLGERTSAIVGAGAWALALDRDRSELWVAARHADSVSRLSAPGLEVRQVVSGVRRPVALALDRERLLVASLGSGEVRALALGGPGEGP